MGSVEAGGAVGGAGGATWLTVTRLNTISNTHAHPKNNRPRFFITIDFRVLISS
jgi:hypothetical protein